MGYKILRKAVVKVASNRFFCPASEEVIVEIVADNLTDRFFITFRSPKPELNLPVQRSIFVDKLPCHDLILQPIPSISLMGLLAHIKVSCILASIKIDFCSLALFLSAKEYAVLSVSV